MQQPLTVRTSLILAVLIIVVGAIASKAVHNRIIHVERSFVKARNECEAWLAGAWLFANERAAAESQRYSAPDRRVNSRYWYGWALVEGHYPARKKIARPEGC